MELVQTHCPLLFHVAGRSVTGRSKTLAQSLHRTVLLRTSTVKMVSRNVNSADRSSRLLEYATLIPKHSTCNGTTDPQKNRLAASSATADGELDVPAEWAEIKGVRTVCPAFGL